MSSSTPDRLVLVVEDDSVTAELLAELVADELGAEAVVAASGMEAIRLARARAPAVVLLDLGLPDLDGLEVTRQLRADPRLVATRIVGMSATYQNEDRALALAARCDAWLPKPFALDYLLGLLAEQLPVAAGATPPPGRVPDGGT